MLGCNGEIYEVETQMCKAWVIESQTHKTEIQDFGLNEHNLVLAAFENVQKVTDMTLNYVKYIISHEGNKQHHILNIIIVTSNSEWDCS